jgi:hypothetical protein
MSFIDQHSHPLQDIKKLLHLHLERALEASARQEVTLFFRADDIGVPGGRFFRLLNLCMDYEVPLSLALVPAWVTHTRWETIRRSAGLKPDLWCWHQHGWRHTNHEPAGKKQEFGPSRSEKAIHRDLDRGRLKLSRILGKDFFPLFTPPWNRCDGRTLSHLAQQRYAGVSRFAGGRPGTPHGLPDYYVNVDLHTRKERDPDQARANLLEDFAKAFSTGYCGVMLHHQRMSPDAFTFLELLFSFVVHSKKIRLIHMAQMATPGSTS